MSTQWLVLACVLFAAHICIGVICPQKNPASGAIVGNITCQNGCCPTNDNASLIFCCETVNVEQIKEEFRKDLEANRPIKPLLPVQVFLVILVVLVSTAASVGLMFIIIKCAKNSPRDGCSWI